MNISDKLMGDYTHAVYFFEDETEKEYRCKAENASEALAKCQGSIGFVPQYCAIVPKQENE